MKKDFENEDDVLETALNFGVKYSAEKYNLTHEQVKKVVKKFQNDIEDLCMCEKGDGNIWCFICTGTKRIHI